ncbi:MAG TPA: terminase small subunit [Tianweitania sediminis]|jgi:phage terminase small subunit|nr:terminase small subunit [Tianweitania sediminis]
MPVLKNARHERFAQELAKGKTATEAMKAAGYSDPRNSSRLTKNDEITRRVDEIKSRVAEKAEWTAADRLQALKTIFDSHAEKDARVAISAIAEANKMQGSYAPQKREHTGPNGGPIQTVDLTNATEEQLNALEAIFGPLATAGGDDASDQGGEGEAGS